MDYNGFSLYVKYHLDTKTNLTLNEPDSIEGTTWLPAGGVSPRHRSLSAGLSYSGDVHKS